MRLWLDSSVIRRGFGFLQGLSDLAKARAVDVVAHAHIHLEVCRSARCKRGPAYQQSVIDSVLEQLGVSIVPVMIDRGVAERWSGLLYERYPTDAAWSTAKLRTLGGQLLPSLAVPPADMPMTTDWWVALQAQDADDWIAVDDGGEEWALMRERRRALNGDEAVAWLDGLPLPSG